MTAAVAPSNCKNITELKKRLIVEPVVGKGYGIN
jgi:hypothetical protein